MAYIHKKLIGGQQHYYLRISTRIKQKVIPKDIAYLGTDPQKIEAMLDKLPQKYHKDIRKGYRNIKKVIVSDYLINKVKEKKIKKAMCLTIELQHEIEALKLHYNDHFLKIDQATQMDIFKQFLIDFAYNSTSLEGNTITLKEAALLLKENLTPKDKSLREIYDLQNTENVFFTLLENNKEITHELIIWIHDTLIEKIDLRKGYRFHDIRIIGSHFDSSPGKYVKADMDILLHWYQEQKNKIHPFVLACIFHQKFEKIHPFSDGNGRSGRMLMNYMLMIRGYPPISIQKSNRAQYINVLTEANNVDLTKLDEKAFSYFVTFAAEEAVHGYWHYFLI